MLTRGQIVRSAFILMAGNASSRVLGFAREAVVVGLFGLTASSSAFITASTVPTMVFDLLVGGAISAALIPVLSDYLREPGTWRGARASHARRDSSVRSADLDVEPGDGAGDQSTRASEDTAEFGRVAGALLTITICASVLLVLLLEAGAPLLVVALGAGRKPDAMVETTNMLRIVLPSIVLLGTAGVVQAVLQAQGIFRYTAASAAGFNLGIILAGLTLSWWFGAISLAIGVVIGAFLQFIIQIPGIRGMGIRLNFDWHNPGVVRALRLYAPVAAGLVLSQIGIVIDRNLAWSTGESSIAMMRSATTLVQLPLGLVATATSFAILPSLSRQIADDRAFVGTLAFGVRVALLMMIPATVLMVALREPIVQILFQRGAFQAEDTSMTALSFLWYAPQMPFWAVDQLLIFAFYARKDTVTPVLVGVVGTLLYLGAALLMVEPLGVFGLILANTLQNSIHCLILLMLLYRLGISLGGHGIVPLIARTSIAAAGGAAAVFLLSQIIGGPPQETTRLLPWLVLVGGASSATVVGCLAILGTPELVQAWLTVRRRFAIA